MVSVAVIPGHWLTELLTMLKALQLLLKRGKQLVMERVELKVVKYEMGMVENLEHHSVCLS